MPWLALAAVVAALALSSGAGAAEPPPIPRAVPPDPPAEARGMIPPGVWERMTPAQRAEWSAMSPAQRRAWLADFVAQAVERVKRPGPSRASRAMRALQGPGVPPTRVGVLPLMAFVAVQMVKIARRQARRRRRASGRTVQSLGGRATVSPTMAPVEIAELDALLLGLYAVNLQQLRAGVPPISPALVSGALRYQPNDPREEWRTIREVWQRGGGDCEDLAAAVAAELTLQGIKARPHVYISGPGTAHAVVRLIDSGRLIDPSVTGGMRGRWGPPQ